MKVYIAYGVAVLALAGFAEYRGWSWTRVNEVKNVPKSIRDNPGAYRSHYGYYARRIGGK